MAQQQRKPLNVSHANDALIDQYRSCRQLSEQLVAPLSEADCQLQSMPDASPAKWHLAHVSWFFETFLLRRFDPSYRVFDDRFGHLFNSYYNAIGSQFSRPHRGLLSRPSLEEVLAYRHHVDLAMEQLLTQHTDAAVTDLTTLGIQHEKQHQELLLTDIKHALYQNPLLPAYSAHPNHQTSKSLPPLTWSTFPEGLYEVGYDGKGFSFDNERPRHKVYLNAFKLANRPVSNGEYLAFIEDGGYQRSEFWLSDGWAWVNESQATAPLYWRQMEDGWHLYQLTGLQPLPLSSTACHINYYEASAFAAWKGKRLPTEQEWEVAAGHWRGQVNDVSAGELQTQAADDKALSQLFGDVWEWTASAYLPYPGFTPFAGDAGEYNGKFMSGQFVLRGGSCVSPANHVRASYRNFFYPHQQWQFSGLRLAEDA